MRRYKSFEEYIQENYYEELFNTIKEHICSDKEGHGYRSYNILEALYTEPDDIHVRKVYFRSSNSSIVDFDAAVEVDIILKGLGKSDYEADMKTEWYTVSFSGFLSDGLNMVTVRGVSEYNQIKFDPKKFLSKYMIPYIGADDYDAVAEEFLDKYYPEALEEPMPIEINQLLENMALKLCYAPMGESTFAKMYFRESEELIYTGAVETETAVIEPGTILVNREMSVFRNEGSLANGIIHECVHADLHSSFFELQKILNPDIKAIECMIDDHLAEESELSKAYGHMERHANAIAPRVLMPARMTRKKIEELLIEYHIGNPHMTETKITSTVIDELASFFHVSKQAAKIRMIDLGFSQAAGCNNYIDGKRIPDFSYKESSLKKGENFIINDTDAVHQTVFNKELQSILETGMFVRVDYAFCLNDKKYIKKDENGNLCLTDYARLHMDECCLKFREEYKTHRNFGKSLYSRCFLCKDVDASVFCESSYIDEEDNQDKKKQAEELRKLLEEGERITEVLSSLPGAFNRSLDELINRATKEDGTKMTNEELEFRTGIHQDTIRKMRKDPNGNPTFHTVAALCIGLHLHPLLSDDLIRKGPGYPNGTEQFFARFILNHHYGDSLILCNEKIASQGFRTWGKDDKIIS